MRLTKEEVQQRVLKDGKPLDLELFEWDEESRTFKSEVDGLYIDFTGIDSVNFNTTIDCMFTTGSGCTFDTGIDCMFKTGGDCVFKTGNRCTFNTHDDCTFDTGSDCTFDTGIDCKFNTRSGCTFKTGSNCTFITIDNSVFNTGYRCTFDTGIDCMFTTGPGCTFNTGIDCMFKTGDNCTFNTGSDCTFDTGIDCKFITGFDCVFNTGPECVFVTGSDCHIRNKANNEVILPPFVGVKLTTFTVFIPGYLVGSDYYVNGVKQEGEYMIVDGILSKIISKKGNVFKVNNYTTHTECFTTTPTYIVQDGDIFAHGETVKEARESLIYKISNRDTSVYDNLTINSVLTKEEAIKMYRVITGSCEYGVRNFVESLPEVKDKYTVQEIVKLTTGRYGNDVLRKFFKI